MTLTPLRSYELFCAMRQHWNSSYDFIKYRGKLASVNRVMFDQKKGLRNLFTHVTKKFKTEDDFISYLIPCFLDNSSFSYEHLLTSESKSVTDSWHWKIIRMKASFKTDCNWIMNFIRENQIKFEYYFLSDLIYHALTEEQIQIESFIILNFVLNFLDKYSTDDILYTNVYEMKVKKYTPFIFVDKEEYKSILEHVIRGDRYVNES